MRSAMSTRRRQMLVAALVAPALCRWPAQCSTEADTLKKGDSMNRLKILCLHGYHGSAATLRSQMAALVNELDALAEFVCIDAPSLAAGDFGWWHATTELRAADPPNAGVGPGAKHYQGWWRTREAIIDIFGKQGPFDGVFGFSQGAALTSILVGLRSPHGRATADKPLCFDFALMVGGFAVADPELFKLYDNASSYQCPTLHIIGRSDRVVPREASRQLANKFPNPLIIEHDGGHVVAATPQVRMDVRQFLNTMMNNKRQAVEPQTQSRPPLRFPLWPNRESPAMTLTFPSVASSQPRPAMLVFAGGSYASCHGSGSAMPAWAAEHEMVGIFVEYGTTSTGAAYPQNYSDAARAVRLVRQNAQEWGINPRRIGVAGFSAGGIWLRSSVPSRSYTDTLTTICVHRYRPARTLRCWHIQLFHS